MTNIETFRDQVRRNLSFLFKHFIVEVREGTKIESRMMKIYLIIRDTSDFETEFFLGECTLVSHSI